jgi:hypothetical protein
VIAGRVIGITLLLLSTSSLYAQPAAAQPAEAAAGTQPTSRKQIVDEMVAAGVAAAARPAIPRPFQTPFGAGRNGKIVAYLIAAHTEREGYKALLQALEARALKQLGSTPGSSGSTSLAMNGLVPDILGVAVESGAINRDVSGTTVTFRATPAGVVKSLQGKGLVEINSDYANSTAARMASRISFAASFDTSNGSTPGTLTADSRQLTGWSARAELVNHRDPASGEYAVLWKGLLRNEDAYIAAVDAINAALAGWPAFAVWQTALEADVKAGIEDQFARDHNVGAAGGRFRAVLEANFAKLEKLPAMPDAVLKALDGYVAQLTRIQRVIDRVYDFVGKGDLITVDWSTARSASLPDLYSATGIWEAAFGASRRTDFTLNVVLNLYRSVPVGAQHQLKSFEITGQFDHPLGSLLSLPAATLTIAGRVSHLPNDTVASADASSPAAVAGRGTIGVVQAKITIPVKGSGLKIPLSITASNRTELIKEKDVRASFGFSFDLDPLIGGLFEKRP